MKRAWKSTWHIVRGPTTFALIYISCIRRHKQGNRQELSIPHVKNAWKEGQLGFSFPPTHCPLHEVDGRGLNKDVAFGQRPNRETGISCVGESSQWKGSEGPQGAKRGAYCFNEAERNQYGWNPVSQVGMVGLEKRQVGRARSGKAFHAKVRTWFSFYGSRKPLGDWKIGLLRFTFEDYSVFGTKNDL